MQLHTIPYQGIQKVSQLIHVPQHLGYNLGGSKGYDIFVTKRSKVSDLYPSHSTPGAADKMAVALYHQQNANKSP